MASFCIIVAKSDSRRPNLGTCHNLASLATKEHQIQVDKLMRRTA